MNNNSCIRIENNKNKAPSPSPELVRNLLALTTVMNTDHQQRPKIAGSKLQNDLRYQMHFHHKRTPFLPLKQRCLLQQVPPITPSMLLPPRSGDAARPRSIFLTRWISGNTSHWAPGRTLSGRSARLWPADDTLPRSATPFLPEHGAFGASSVA